MVFNRGDGQDSWRDNGVVGYSGGVRYDPGMDTLQFGAGIAKSDLSLSRQGSHLVVDVRDPAGVVTGDRITILGWFDNAAQVVERFVFADGSELMSSQASLLCQAMAGFAPQAFEASASTAEVQAQRPPVALFI